MSTAERFVRFHNTILSDNRTPSQIDRDRVMYTSAFRRLANVTQVVGGDENHVFHNRLTHSLQVAQVARRIAERLIKGNSQLSSKLCPDVCEAAALAHDIGHPPFGHLAEKILNKRALDEDLLDGFEGNAQSFRIVARLAAHDVTCEGLDLTKATLNALLKYPWLKDGNDDYPDKWGAYSSEATELGWARELSPVGSDRQSLEAQIMDWADDVTYSVHDVEDFYRAGLIPLDRLGTEEQERENFCSEVFERKKGKLPAAQSDLRQILEDLSGALWTTFAPFSGSFLQRQTLKAMSSNLIGDYVTKVGVDKENNLAIEHRMKCEIFMLKQLTWHYVILNPSLATQQEGQKRVINGLFDTYKAVIDAAFKDSEDEEYDGSFRLFPKIYRESLLHQMKRKSPRSALIRILIDMIAGMTEHQAIHTYHRLTGANTRSPLSPAIR